MVKILLILLISVTCMSGCSTDENSSDKHTDSFISIDIENSDITKNEEDNDTEGNNMIEYDDEGNITIDTSKIPDNVGGDDPEFTVFKYASDSVKTADTDSYEDIYNIADKVGNIGAVIKRIDTLGKENNFENCVVYYSSFEESDRVESGVGVEEHFIIALDYDFYVIDYYLDEGAVSTHDDTGKISEEYIEPEEEVEWFD